MGVTPHTFSLVILSDEHSEESKDPYSTYFLCFITALTLGLFAIRKDDAWRFATPSGAPCSMSARCYSPDPAPTDVASQHGVAHSPSAA